MIARVRRQALEPALGSRGGLGARWLVAELASAGGAGADSPDGAPAAGGWRRAGDAEDPFGLDGA